MNRKSALLTVTLFSTALLVAAGCKATSEEDETEQGEDAFSQTQVDSDPTLKKLQLAAANVNQYEINVDDIPVPDPSASVGADANGFSTRGLDWFKNPAVTYPNNKSWDQGTDTGKKCQWASIFRFQAIFADPPAEALEMKNLQGGMWSGSFWSWIDDYASTDSVGQPTQSYAWSSGLWKWIAASGKDGLCRIPTKTMVKRMMVACKIKAEESNGDPKNCRMPTYDPAQEPATDAGAGGDAATEGGASDGATDGGTPAADAASD